MPSLRIDGTSAGAVKAVGDLQKAFGKLEGQMELTTKESAMLDRAANRIVKNNEQPLERYNRKVAELAMLVKQGKLSHEQAEMAAKRYGISLERAGQKGKQAFGQQAVSQLASYVTGILGVTAAISKVTQFFTEMETQAQGAADRVFGSLSAIGELQQVSSSPEEFRELVGFSRGLIRRGIFSPDQQAEAAKFTFALQSAGFDAEGREFIAGLGEQKIIAPQNLQSFAAGAKKFQDIFGADETGNLTEVSKKLFAASSKAQATVSEIAESATLFGTEATGLGISDEEALAAFIAIERGSPNKQIAATRLRSLLNALVKNPELQRGTLAETVGELRARIQSGEQPLDIVGNTRAAAGLGVLAGEQFGNFQRFITEFPKGQGAQSFIADDPILAAAAGLETARGRREALTVEGRSEVELLYDQFVTESRSRLEREGKHAQSAYFGAQAAIYDVLGLEESTLRAQLRFGNEIQNPELQSRIEDYLRRSAEGIERVEANQRGAAPPVPSGAQE